MDLSGKSILLGVTGGIAAYKSVRLLRELQKAGADVRVVMTPAATRFVGVETFATLSRSEVPVHVFSEGNPGDSWTKHIHWAEWADLMVVAPCTANTLAKLVHGLADNILASIALAARCPLLLCPTMDAGMLHHPAVERNLALAQESGYQLLMPESGYLASGLEGEGRLPDAGTIVQEIERILGDEDSPERLDHKLSLVGSEGPLAGKRVVVTAGPTREPIDAVRFISNPSSGKMGIAMAMAARQMGADVTLLHGPLSVPVPHGLQTRSFMTAAELRSLLLKLQPDADWIIMTAAVADFRPEESAGHKIKKQDGVPSLKLVPTPDILSELGERRREGQILVGFAMETEDLESQAEEKLEKKKIQWICGNDLSNQDSGFASDTNRILLLGPDHREWIEGSKRDVALQILQTIASRV
ncbi:MAG: bifunctional phosphopantothenoylcysteine decarboxylase/phosphopantothenate--cysteine ligase CoaBC [Bacteroidota bacterium]